MADKYTLDEQVVIKSLEAIATQVHEKTNEGQEVDNPTKLLLIGGIANQLYCHSNYPHLIRPTADLDILTDSFVGYPTFRDVLAPRIESQLNGYNPQHKQAQRVYEILLEEDSHRGFMIHFPNLSRKRYGRLKGSLERQVSSSLEFRIPNSEKTVRVQIPEEIFYHKMHRLRIIEKEGHIPRELEKIYRKLSKMDWISLSGIDINTWTSDLKKQKEMLPAYFDHGLDVFIPKIREYTASKDIFDLLMLTSLAVQNELDFNEDMYKHIIESEKSFGLYDV